ncbi:MAG: recombination-associated protein RdgC [Kiritimatiellales bacterium]|nr:recombination-associated protein RdgC [Kiritimatiellota bacterium]MBL7011566.1 recombination-associated protein RdgC [Kiritimatiellales bacterium]
MSFESGSVSLRMFYVPKELPDDILERFAEHTIGSVDTLRDEEIHGWVGPRHLLDREISEDNALPGGYLRLTLTQAQRKIPTALLRAECRIEEMVWMAAEQRDYINRQTRSEIKKEVTEKLLPQMPPTLKGIDFVYDRAHGLLYVTAMSEKQLDAFLINFTLVAGVQLVAADPAAMAWQLAQSRTDSWHSLGFAADQWADCAPGREFLMWLWFISEAKGGEINLPESGPFAMLVEGPLQFDQEEQGEIVIRKGEPMVSAETRAALLSGKKLRRAKLTLARGEEIWNCTLDADEFIFRGLKLPKTEAYDVLGKFTERMEFLETFRIAFGELYKQFVEQRDSDAARENLRTEMREWIRTRPARKTED